MAEGGVTSNPANESTGEKLTECSRSSMKDTSGNTPLHLAAKNGHSEAIKILLNLGTPLEERNLEGETPLFLAVSSGSEEAVRALLEAGADFTVETKNGTSIWHAAASVGHVGIFNLLVDRIHRKPANETFKKKTNDLLKNSSSSSYIEPIKVESGINTDRITNVRHDSTKIDLNVLNKKENPVDLPFKNPSNDIFMRKENSWEKIYKLAEEVNSDTDEDTIDFGLDEIRTTSPEIEAKLWEEKMTLQKRLEFMTALGFLDVNSKDEEGFSDLHKAVACGAEKTALRLIKRRADVNAEAIGGLTPILLTPVGGSLKVFNKLVESGANYNKTDDKRRNALHVAANKGDVPIAKRLLSLGLDVNAKCTDGNTALHYAVMMNHNTKMCKLLIQNGAKVTEQNKYGLLPINFVTDSHNFELIHLLRQFK